MATKSSTIDYLLDQLSGAGSLTSRKMFGEYALYCEGKVIGFVCDDRLYIKPTEATKAYYGTSPLAPPYPGAKLYLCPTLEQCEDRIWLSKLITLTVNALPVPKVKKK